MARSRSRRGDSSNPNKVLVVFLVLFVLTTLGLGGWIYSMFGDRHRGAQLKKEAQDTEAAAKKREEWAEYRVAEMRAMLGDPTVLEDKSTDHENWKTARAAVIDASGAEPKFLDGGKFAAFDKE